MADSKRRVTIKDCRGGMNGVDDPLSLAENECLYAYNVDWFRAPIAHKRYGSTSFDMTGATMTGKVSALIPHVPGTSETAAEMWAVDDAATPIINRFASGAWSAPTLKDNPNGSGWNTFGASLDGKLYMAYASAQNRLHVWDTSTVRRSGITPGSSAPTVANTGAGAYPATTRYYRVRFSVSTNRISEPTPSVSFTPSGGGTAARVTMPAVPNEGETHWILEASTDDVVFYQIAYDVIAVTTTYDDSIAVAIYDLYPLSPSIGTFTLHKPYKFIASDQNRLLGFGSYNSSDQQHRVWFSDIVGGVTLGALGNPSTDAADRLNTTGGYFLDLDENDSGVPTGLAGPLNGAFYAFKSTQIWELRATGDSVSPFKATVISKTVGAVCQQAIVRGEDEQGRPCLYFMSQFGPYRYGANGLEWIGRAVDNYIRGVGSHPRSVSNTIDLSPTAMSAVALYYPAKKQVWWWLAVNEVSDANGLTACLMYDVVHGGWAEQSHKYARAAMLYAHPQLNLPAKVPYMAYANANETIYVLDHPGAVTDAGGVTFASYIYLRPIEPGGPGMLGSITGVEVLVQNASGGGLFRVEAQAELADTLVSGNAVTLATTTGAEWIRASNVGIGDLHAAHVLLGNFGDGVADNVWRVHRVVICVAPQEASVS